MDYLDFLPRSAQRDSIITLRREHAERLSQPKKGFQRFKEPFQAVSHLHAAFTDFSCDAVRIGKACELTPEDRQTVLQTLQSFMPWRKGPFEVFGIEVDAEWRSERKWNRLLPVLPDLAGKIVADIGCSNGYYMFRMLPHQPRLVVGFEPTLQHYYCFQTLNHLAGIENLFVEPLGVEHIALYNDCFDVVFLMGIIYHRISPIDVLRDIREAMRPGGTLIVESQAIPGSDPVALFPEERYAKVPGTYFVPTGPCLKNWMTRAGFADVEIFCSHPMSNQEQRKTAWMTFESFDDFIDPKNPDRTVEGYPAPWRVFLKGTAR
jgi:tRNA (mo5U34)-methyltransferase